MRRIQSAFSLLLLAPAVVTACSDNAAIDAATDDPGDGDGGLDRKEDQDSDGDAGGNLREGEVCDGMPDACMAGLACCYPCGVPGCQSVCTKPDPNTMQCPWAP
jgi:hypothetical protein